MASPVPEISILGETTEASLTSPERSVTIFHLCNRGTDDQGFYTALKDLEELPLREGESPTRSNHIKKYLPMVFGTLGSIQDFLEKEAKSVDGVQYKFVEILQKLKEPWMSGAPAVPDAGVFSSSHTNIPGVSGIKLSCGADPSLNKLPLPEDSKDRYVGRVHDDQLFVVAINTSPRPADIRIDIPEEDVPLDERFGGGIMKKLAEKCEWVLMGGESATEMVKLVGAGLYASSNTNLAGPSWAMDFVGGAKLVGFVCTVAALGTLNHRPALSKVMIKSAAISAASGIIMSLAMPLPLAVALPVGLAGWITVVTTVLRN